MISKFNYELNENQHSSRQAWCACEGLRGGVSAFAKVFFSILYDLQFDLL